MIRHTCFNMKWALIAVFVTICVCPAQTRDGAELWTREFGTADAAWASGVAADASGVYVVGDEGTAQFRDDYEHFDAFAPVNPTHGTFLAKLENGGGKRRRSAASPRGA